MKKQTLIRNLFFVLLLVLSIVWVVQAQENTAPDDLAVTGPGRRYTETIPVIDIRDYGYQPMQLPNEAINNSQVTKRPWSPTISQLDGGGGSDPNNPYAVIRKTGPAFLQPGGTAHYEISLANYESITHTYQLTDTLPPQLAYVPGSATSTTDGDRPRSVQASDLIYDPATRTLAWQGELSPGHLDYVIEENSLTLPYLDLADFGAVNLCEDLIANGEDCDDVTVTFNLGVNGYTTNLYGETLTQLVVSSNGIVLAGDGPDSQPQSGHNQWLPDATPPGHLLAGLWRDVDMGGADTGTSGRWHAAIISGLIEGHSVFYAQWHNAPHANDPDLTARNAIAILLNDDGNTSAGSAQDMAGHAFFIYDNISDPAQTVAQGYTIGIEDKLGVRGVTYAYAPCCGDPQPPQGYSPAAGTTLHLRPVLFGAANDYHRTFSYEAIVNGQVPETITNTAVATSSSGNPALASVWSTHYLYVRLPTYIPLLRFEEVVGP
jgi:uncharacterized repeat protein (TIGR01451 family)